jgi:NADH-quinone oxidoreductase subunit M
MPRAATAAVRGAALAAAVATFVVSIGVAQQMTAGAELQLVEQAPWVPVFGITYALGVDGISVLLVLLTTFLTPLVLLAACRDVHQRQKEFFAFFLLLETGMLGALLALDLFLFYVFWEVMLVPMAFLIGVWGGSRRLYAAIKFVLFTMAGSLPMLIAILYLGARVKAVDGVPGFGYERFLALHLTPTEQLWCFAAFALAFAIKVPLFPLHSWLPDAHTEAPTGGSVILAGVLLKLGTYGFLRFALPLFPAAVHQAAPLVIALAVIGIVYGALVATVQPDVKRLVAYSSVSHLGFVMLGLFALDRTAVAGAVIQMVNHGLSTGALFLLIGMIYERRHTRQITDFGGLWAVIPRFSVCFMVAMFASAGLPGLNGFVGEFLILLGAFRHWPWATTIASSGVVLGALYLLWMYQRVIFGPVVHEANRRLSDLSPLEYVVIVPVLALCVAIGVRPAPLLRVAEPAIDRILARVEAAAVETTVATAVGVRR